MPGDESDRAARVLADTIMENKKRIEMRWLELVERDVVKTPGIEPTQLRDGLRTTSTRSSSCSGERGRETSS